MTSCWWSKVPFFVELWKCFSNDNNNNTVKPVLNGISRDQNIFPLKPGFRLIKVHYIQYKKLNQDMQTLTLRW